MTAKLYGIDGDVAAGGATFAVFMQNVLPEEGLDINAQITRAIGEADESPRERRIRRPAGAIHWIVAARKGGARLNWASSEMARRFI